MTYQSPFHPKTSKPNKKICCPNHGEPLEGIGFPMPSKGTGICPVSGVRFDYEVEIDNTEAGQVLERDANGNLRKVPGTTFKVSGDEN